MVPFRRAARGDQGADAALRPARDPRHRDLARRAPSLRRRRDPVLGQLVVPALLRRLRPHVRLGLRLPLARMRPSHRLPHPVAERRHLPAHLVHALPQSGPLALEPRPPPHRHPHRRPRRRDLGDAPAGSRSAPPSPSSPTATSAPACRRWSATPSASSPPTRRTISPKPNGRRRSAPPASTSRSTSPPSHSRSACARGCRSSSSARPGSTAAGTSRSAACSSTSVSPTTCSTTG